MVFTYDSSCWGGAGFVGMSSGRQFAPIRVSDVLIYIKRLAAISKSASDNFIAWAWRNVCREAITILKIRPAGGVDGVSKVSHHVSRGKQRCQECTHLMLSVGYLLSVCNGKLLLPLCPFRTRQSKLYFVGYQ